VDKQEIILTPEEYEVLKQASLQGLNQVWFQDKMLSINHIKSIEEKVEYIDDTPLLPDLSPMEQEKARIKLQEIRSKLIKKVSIN
jgi:hypothetical protein